MSLDVLEFFFSRQDVFQAAFNPANTIPRAVSRESFPLLTNLSTTNQGSYGRHLQVAMSQNGVHTYTASRSMHACMGTKIGRCQSGQ